jgi:hypothetical protein
VTPHPRLPSPPVPFPLIVLAVLLVMAGMAYLRHMTRRHGIGPLLWRWHTGQSLDGMHRTNATWTMRSHGDRPVLHPTGHAVRWHHWPRRRRAGIRVGAEVTALLLLYGLLADRTVTVATLAVLAAAGLALAAWLVVRAVRRWRHVRHYEDPLKWDLLRAIAAPPVRLEITRGGDVIEGVVIAWPPETEIGEQEKRDVLEAVTTRLAIEAPDPKWKLEGRNRLVTYTPSEPPPEKVTLRDMRTAIEGTGPDEIAVGLGRRRTVVLIDLHDDSPHVAESIGPGGGKTNAARFLAIQVLRKGGLVVVLNAKRSGYNWTRGLPNVAHCKTIDEIAAMLIWLDAERQKREDVAEVSGDIEDVVHANVGARILIIFEEQNLTVPKIKKDHPDAFEALGDMNFAGRAARMNMVAIAQRYSAKAAGGGDVRATVCARILGRYEKSAWKMLAEAFPMPAPSNTPGRVQVVTDRVAEAQMPYIGGQEAHDFALSGAVALCPADMPARCAIGAGVPLGQLVNTGPEQPLSQGQEPVPALSPPRLMGLAEACAEGVIGISYEAARKRRDDDRQ